MRFEFIQRHRHCWPIEVQCRVLRVSRAGYYKWRRESHAAAPTRQVALKQHIQSVHREVSRDYGSPRVHRELLERGVACCVNTVAKVMQRFNIRARRRKKYRPAGTDSRHHLPLAPNRLNQHFEAAEPNRVWLTDITYVPVNRAFSYVCTVQDLYSRKIVGWAISQRPNAQLALEALQQAVDLRSPAAGCILHSDRGSQFASEAFRQRLQRHGLTASMSRKGNCYDNAPMESFYRSLKMEAVQWANYQSHAEAARGVRDYIERFYNRVRRHSALGYVSPCEFEARPVQSSA